MNSKTKYRIIAVLICIVIYAIYISLSVSMDWGHGGGYLVLVILVGILRAVWKGVTNLADEEDKTNETPTTPQEDILPEIPVDVEEEPLPAEEVIPIPIEETDESILQKDNEDLPPIPDIEEDRTTIVAPTEEPEMFNQQPKTHWQKFRLYYTITIALCVIVAVAIPVTMHIHEKKQVEAKQKQVLDFIDKAKSAYDQSFYDLAIKYLNSAAEIDTFNYSVNYLLGKSYFEKEDYSSADKYFGYIYYRNTQHDRFTLCDDTVYFNDVLYFYCGAKIMKGDFLGKHGIPSDYNATLMAISQEYLSLYPKDYRAYKTMAYTHYRLKNNLKAVEWAKKMVEKYPLERDSYYCLAYILSDIGRNKEAIDNYKKCIEIEASDSWAYNNIGVCYMDIGNKQKAYECWRKAVQINGNETAINNLKRHGQSY